MFKGFYNLASGMITQGRYLDVLSNNMTNVSTAGYKTDQFTATTFDEALWYLVGNKEKDYAELGVQSFMTVPSRLYTNYDQASFDETGLPLDFGIEGDGFFAIQNMDGDVMYTRNGSFNLDDEGYLCLSGYGRVLSNTGESIRLVTDKIQADNYGGLYTEDGGFLGRLGVYVFEDNGELEKNDLGFFTGEGAEAAGIGSVLVHNGMLERSNTDWVDQLTQMMSSERAYQSCAEAIKIYDEMMTRITTEVGRLS